MAVTLQVLYPTTPGTSFDYDYYTGTHLPMVSDHFGPHLDSVLVAKGIAMAPDGPPAFYAVASLVFADQAAMDAAMAKAGPVLEDIPKFTDTAPQMLIGETLA